MTGKVDIDDVFGGIKEAKVMAGGNYIAAGHYVFLIQKIKLDRNRTKEVFYATELTVLGHISPDCESRVGEDVTHIIMQKWDGFLGDVKAQLATLLECPQDDIDLDACKTVCAEDQPLKGMIIEVKAWIKTTNAGKPFTSVKYVRSIPDAEAREMLGEDICVKYLPAPAAA